jgi:hypothetical protein
VSQENPYPDARDVRLSQVERRQDSQETKLERLSELLQLKTEMAYFQRETERSFTRIEKKLDDHIKVVEPLIAADASRSGFSTGIKAWIQYGLLTLVVVAGLLLNVLVAVGVFK